MQLVCLSLELSRRIASETSIITWDKLLVLRALFNAYNILFIVWELVFVLILSEDQTTKSWSSSIIITFTYRYNKYYKQIINSKL